MVASTRTFFIEVNLSWSALPVFIVPAANHFHKITFGFSEQLLGAGPLGGKLNAPAPCRHVICDQLTTEKSRPGGDDG